MTMTADNEFFTPEEVDEQIDQLTQGLRSHSITDAEAARAISHLRQLYARNAQKHTPALERAWKRVLQEHSQKQKGGQLISMQDIQHDQQTLNSSRSSRIRRGWVQRLGIVAAVVLIAILVGSMVLIFNAARESKSNVGSGHPAAQSSPSAHQTPASHSPNLGNVVYSRKYSDATRIYSVAISPDGKRVAVGSTGGAQSWDITTGKNVVTYDTSGNASTTGGINALSWSPDGSRLAGAGGDVRIWNARTGSTLINYSVQKPLAMNTASRQILTTTLSFSLPTMPISGGTGASATAWSPDGTLMASAFSGSVYGKYGNIIEIWNTTTGKMTLAYTGHMGAITSLSWVLTGKYIVSSSVDGTAQVWSATTGKLLYKKSNIAIFASASPDGSRITTAIGNGYTVQVWDAMTGNVLATHRSTLGLDALVWSPDGKSVASAGNPDIELWSAETGKTYFIYKHNTDSISVLDWSPDDRYIVSASYNATVQVWIAA